MGNAEKGFGFIKPDKGDEDLFCHVSGLLDGDGSVREGDRVKYNSRYDERRGKLRAGEVVLEGGGGRRGGDRGGDRGRGRDDSRGRGGDRGRGRNDSRSPPRRQRARSDSRRRR